MAFTNFVRSMAPTPAGPGQTSKPGVGVGDNGRILLTRAASEAFSGCKAVSLAYDGATRTVQITGMKAAPKGKEAEYPSLNWPKKGAQTAGFAASGFLHWAEYDYKTAGNQSYDAHMGKGAVLTFVLPAETPAPKPKQKRTRKAKTAAAVAPPAAQAPPAAGEFESCIV